MSSVSSLLALLIGVAEATPSRVAVVVSDDLAAYRAPAEGFLQAFAQDGEAQPRFYNLYGRRQDAEIVSKELERWNPHVVVCVGAKAAYAIKQELPSTPLVYLTVLDRQRYGIEGPQVTGVNWVIDPVPFLSQFVGFFPDVDTVGVIVGSGSGSVPEARQAAMKTVGGDLGKTVVIKQIGKASEARAAFRELVEAGADALWLPFDRDLFTVGTVRTLTDEARLRHMPVLADAEGLVNNEDSALATFTMVPDPDAAGAQAAELVRKILDGAAPAILPPVDPEKLLVVFNKRSADAAGIVVDDLLLDLVDVLQD